MHRFTFRKEKKNNNIKTKSFYPLLWNSTWNPLQFTTLFLKKKNKVPLLRPLQREPSFSTPSSSFSSSYSSRYFPLLFQNPSNCLHSNGMGKWLKLKGNKFFSLFSFGLNMFFIPGKYVLFILLFKIHFFSTKYLKFFSFQRSTCRLQLIPFC